MPISCIRSNVIASGLGGRDFVLGSWRDFFCDEPPFRSESAPFDFRFLSDLELEEAFKSFVSFSELYSSRNLFELGAALSLLTSTPLRSTFI